MNLEDRDYAGQWTESGSVDSQESVINETVTESESAVAITTERVHKLVERAAKSTNDNGLTRDIVKRAMQGVLNGPGCTPSDKERQIMQATEGTISKTSPKSAIVVTTKTQRALSQEPSETSTMVELGSTSLLDESAQLLYEGMKRVLSEETVSPVRKEPIDTFKINAAANCAKQIANLLRVKVEVYKALKN